MLDALRRNLYYSARLLISSPAFTIVAIVNEEFARQIFGTQNPLGQRFRVELIPTEPQSTLEVVGNGSARNCLVKSGSMGLSKS